MLGAVNMVATSVPPALRGCFGQTSLSIANTRCGALVSVLIAQLGPARSPVYSIPGATEIVP